MKRSIFVTFQKEGIHCYPEALTDDKLEGVSFLGYPHRHMFHFKVELSVEHNNRDIEFILLKREIESWYSNDVLQLNYKSCEMIAEDLINKLHDRFPLVTMIRVTVSEDNENGAILEEVY